MNERRGTKALELWCKKMTEGYPGVKVENMTSSWRDGLAFCAIIHHFRPELIDFSKLNKDDVFYNNDLAFTVAEKYLGIPALLEPEDMVEYDVPDRLSILTYLSQFYKTFVATRGSSPARIVPKRPANSSERGSIGSPASTSPPTKMALRSGGGGVPRREPCAKCGNPVYIAERLAVGKSLYHRTCFRCARCNSQLTLANCYETETPNQFCCETCPDEETKSPTNGKGKTDEKSMLSRSLSDEEKSAGLKKLSNRQQQQYQQQKDEYSEKFETALEDSILKQSEYFKARSQFLTSNLEDNASDSELPPELPKTKPPDINIVKNSPNSSSSPPSLTSGRSERQRDIPSEISINKPRKESKDLSGSSYYSAQSPNLEHKLNISSSSVKNKSSENKITNPSDKSVNQSSVTNLQSAKSKYLVTKDKIQPKNDSESPSLVKNRMKLFEKSTEVEVDRSDQIVKSPKSPRQFEKKAMETAKFENLKRPLVDAAVVSPEKKFSLDRKEPPFLKSLQDARIEPRPVDKVKSPKEIAQSQTKSLHLLLQKQIALKEGKITPKALINQTKTDAESSENVATGNVKSKSLEQLQTQRRKSMENLTGTKSYISILTEGKSPTEESTKSLLSSNRKSSFDSKIKALFVHKIETPSNKLPVSNKSVSNVPIASPRKSNLQNNRPTSLNLASKIINTQRLKKQQSVEEIPKVTSRQLLSKHWKENVCQDKRKSTEKLDSKPSDYSVKQVIMDSPRILKRSTSENSLKSLAVGHPLKKDYMSTGSMGLNEYRRNKSRMSMYVSDTELNNILNRENKDWLSSPKLKSMEYQPMRSIENLYRSNSEENVAAYRSSQNNHRIHYESVRNSVSAIKNKFECLSVVESRPQSVSFTKEAPVLQTDADTLNNSVPEIQSDVESNGEILRDGHMTTTVEDLHNFSISSIDRSDINDNSDIIIIDLTKDEDQQQKEEDLSQSQADAVTISDDSAIEISDSSANQTGPSGKLEVTNEDLEASKVETIEYPEDLNPFGDEDNIKEHETNTSVTEIKSVNTSLNPFEDDEDEKEPQSVKNPTPAVRKKIIPIVEDSFHEGDTPEYLRKVRITRISTNPFEDDEEDDEDGTNELESNSTAAPSGPPKKLIAAPRISLNPFWSDVDEDEPEYDDEDNRSKPVPKPRRLRNAAGHNNTVTTPEPKPRASNLLAGAISFGSNSSLSSGQSGGQSVRKKKPAPRPPIIVTEAKTESPPESSLTSSPSTSLSQSPRLPVKIRKLKKAPLPPSSTPQLQSKIDDKSLLIGVSPITSSPISSKKDLTNESKKSSDQEDWDNEKIAKDKVNENRRSQLFNSQSLIIPSSNDLQDYVPNKSTYGKWKRKKGPAPSRPVPQRRMIKALPVSEFRKELDLIELQKQGLEKQGVRLEQIIRDRCEGPERDEVEVCNEDTVPIDVEDLILQLFEVVNEKNELSRREAELMYLQRQQRLEEEHAEVEYQIRCLMMQPEVNKTDSDKAREEELIQRLVEIVECRNEIIECLEMDRLREAEEDDSISTSLTSYASRRDEQLAAAGAGSKTTSEENILEETTSKKEKSKKGKKEKKSKSKKSQVMDADKDVDESETSIVSVKEKKKKKFTLF